MALDPIQKASRDQFDRHSANYGKSHILANTADVASALTGIEALPGSRALDVATGGGHTATYLATQGFTVTASDISQAMLDSAQRLAAERGLSIETRLHEAEKFPYPVSSYDLVTCRVAAHHFSNREAFLAEVTRVLKPGGHFLLIDGTIPDGEPIAEKWIHELEKLRDPSHRPVLVPRRLEGALQPQSVTGRALRDYALQTTRPKLVFRYRRDIRRKQAKSPRADSRGARGCAKSVLHG